MKEFNYEIILKDEGTYNCQLKKENNYYIVIIVEPSKDGHWQEMFTRNFVKENYQWRFSNRELPITILNLERELSDFLILEEKKQLNN